MRAGKVSPDIKCPVLFAIKGADKLPIAFLGLKFLSFQQRHVLRRNSNKITVREKVRRYYGFRL
jgi:hypothetical protein